MPDQSSRLRGLHRHRKPPFGPSRTLLTGAGLLLVTLVGPVSLLAQRQADSTERLSYRFQRPSQTALDLAMSGLRILDGEFMEVGTQRGDSIVEVIARVRDDTWQRNPEVRGASAPGDPGVYFGLLRTYLRGEQRFRILVIPAACAECQGDLRVSFLPFSDSTGYLVGTGRSR